MRYFGKVAAIIAVCINATGAHASGAPVSVPKYLLVPAKPRVLRASLPFEYNAEVRSWIQFFSGPGRDRFAKFLKAGSVYKTLIQDMLVERKLPAEFFYLAMIESGMAVHAVSRAEAVGLWQLMRPTAMRFGLRVDREVDERLDVVRATHAASRYLAKLHREFGSWYLAMAAYNAGERRIRTAIRRAGTRDYWQLARRGYLPRETARYVPQFQAAMLIARNPEQFGFTRHEPQEFPTLKQLRIRGPLALGQIALHQGVSLEALRATNPHLIRGRAPAGRGAYVVWVPSLDRGT